MDWPTRVRLWDEALAAARAYLRSTGSREVSTAIRVEAPALEPWIEPVAAGESWLATSPELAMKRLLTRGSGSIFQLAHVFRAGEKGRQHHPEFHLLEWYRTPGELPDVLADVERVIAQTFEVADRLKLVRTRPAPRRWTSVELLELMRETTGLPLVGDEPADALKTVLEPARDRAGVRWRLDAGRVDATDLGAWTEWFSLWSDLELDPWLGRQDPDVGIHVVGFPRALAALAEVRGPRAERFETHVHGVELANGYLELRDAVEQRARFGQVAALRHEHGLASLPMPEGFLADLADPGLPPTAGVALGFDRLLALAAGVDSLDAIALG